MRELGRKGSKGRNENSNAIIKVIHGLPNIGHCGFFPMSTDLKGNIQVAVSSFKRHFNSPKTKKVAAGVSGLTADLS